MYLQMKNMLKLSYKILLLLLLLEAPKAFSQGCPPNIGFELGDMTQWQSFINNGCAGLGCCPINACSFQGVNFQIPGRIEVTDATWGNDALCGIPCVCPVQPPLVNLHSLKLGNLITGSESEKVRIQFPVNSNNSTLIYRYAAVLNSGGHAATDQPRVVFTVYDAGPITAPYTTPVVVPCPSYNIPSPTSSTNMPPFWFVSPNNSQVFCSNWIPVSVNLAALNTHLVILEFATGDCSFGGHFGYSYVDIPGGCNPFRISTGYCPGQSSATLYGPPGFSNYSWYQLPGWTNIGNFDSVVITAPAANTPYACVVTPPGGTSCNDTLVDTLKVAPLPTAYFTTSQQICANSPVQFTDSSYTNFPIAYINSWHWDFGDPNTGANNYSTQQNPIHIFSDTGVFHVQLIVTSSISCVSDTALFTILNVAQPPVYPNAGPDQSICLNTSTTLNPVSPPNPNYSIAWTTNNGLHWPANGIVDTTLQFANVTPTATTTYYYTITNPVLGCSFTDSVVVNIVGVAPDAHIVASDDTICPNANSQLSVSVTPTTCGATNIACNGTPSNINIGTGGMNVSTYPGPFAQSYSDGRMQMIVRASELVNAGFSAGQISGISFNVTGKGSSNPFHDFKISMGCATSSQYASASFIGGLSLVYSKSIYNTVNGTNTFLFQTPYNWDGVSNLAFEFCFDNSSANMDDLVAQSPTAFSSCVYALQSGVGNVGCNLTTGTLFTTSFNRPTITLITCNSNLNTASYVWTPTATLSSSTINNPIATPTTNTTYTVTVDDGNGCQTTTTKTIYIDNTTSINAGPNASICKGSVYTLNPTVTGTGPFNYNWTSTPAGFTSLQMNPTVSPSVTTTYHVTAVGYSGCTVTSNVTITVKPVPTANFTVNPNPVCSGANATVNFTGVNPAGSTASWNWNGGTVVSGTGFGPYTITWATAGTKNVKLIVNSAGCLDSITIPVIVNQTPTSGFTVIPNPVCTGTNAVVSYTGTPNALFNYNWNLQGAIVSSGSGSGPYQAMWNSAGTKNLTLTVTNGNCTSTTTVPLVVNLTPTSTFVAPIKSCTGYATPITYTGNMGAGASYIWAWDGGVPTGGPGAGPYTVNWSTAGIKNVSLTVTSNGCTSAPTVVPVNVTLTPTNSFSLPASVCSGNQVAVTYTGNATNTAGFVWNTTGNVNPVQLSGLGPHGVTWTNNSNSIFNATVSLSVTENGCTSTTNTQTIQVVPIPTANFTVTSPTCAFDTARFVHIGGGVVPGANYAWTFNSMTSQVYGSGAGPIGVIWNNPGTYNVTLTVSQNGCVSTPVTSPIAILPVPTVIIHSDTSICPGRPAYLWVSGADSYSWLNGINSNLPAIKVWPPMTTSYSVIGTLANGCTGKGTAIVTVLVPPAPDAGPDTMIVLGNTANIGGLVTPNYLYQWSPAATVANPVILNTQATPPVSTFYIVEATDQNGCIGYDTMLVIVTHCSNVFIPTAFSPNGDGKNERFFIANGSQLVDLKRFEVFNRWGQKVYSSKNRMDLGWDGKFNGVDQEVGTYTFYLEAECEGGQIVRKEGHVTLLR